MRLRDALEILRKQPGAPTNAYDWYRRSAMQTGRVSFGGVDIPATKEGGVWTVAEEAVHRAIKKIRQQRADLERRLDEVRSGRYEDAPGTFSFLGGGYSNHGPFRFIWDDMAVARKKNDGTWHCRDCQKPARTEYDKEECHTCQDWGGCGRDCTTSAIVCSPCGNRMTV